MLTVRTPTDRAGALVRILSRLLNVSWNAVTFALVPVRACVLRWSREQVAMKAADLRPRLNLRPRT